MQLISKLYRLILGLGVIAIPIAALADDALTSRIKECEALSKSDPQALLRQMDNLIDQDLNANGQLKKYYCTAQAQLALIYPEKAVAALDQLDAALESDTNPWIVAKSQTLRAAALDALGKPMPALEEINSALSWAQENKAVELEVDALKVSGLVKISLIDYPGALKDLNQAYTLAAEMEEEVRVSVGSYIALVYEYREEYDLAIPYFALAADYYRQQNSAGDASIALYGLGNANAKLEKLEVGRSHLQESLKFAEQIDDTQGVAYALKELANIDYKEQQYQPAEAKLLTAQNLTQDANNPFLKLDIFSYLIDVYLAQGKIEQANSAVENAKQLIDPESMPIHLLRLEQRRAALSAAEGKFEAAYSQLVKVIDERIKLINEQSSKQLLQLRSQYELEAKEQENKLLQKINQSTASELHAQRSRNLFLLLLLSAAAIIFVLFTYIVLKNREVRKKLEVLANVDTLTGLNNRRRVFELIENQMRLAYRHQFSIALATFDLDHFKSINDNHGHHTGDLVLKAFGKLLMSEFRGTDISGRIGGEEFVLAMPHAKTEQALARLEKFRLKVHSIPSLIENQQLKTSFSCGLVAVGGNKDLTTLLAEADKSLYQAKAQGRDRIVVAG